MRKSVVATVIAIGTLGINIHVAKGQTQTWGQNTPTGDRACSILQTFLPCTSLDMGKNPVDIAWGAAGSVGYTLGTAEMSKRSPGGSSLTTKQKDYLRFYFGSLVDRVTIHYRIPLLTEIFVGNKKVSFGGTAAQTFGLNIYLSEPYKTTLSQVALIGHELVHSKQYETLGSSIFNFGNKYFQKYSEGGSVYENNEMEIEAYVLQANLMSRLKSQLKQNDCSRDYLSGECPKGTIPADYSDDYDYGSRRVVFSLDGTESTVSTESPPEAKEGIPVVLSTLDEARLASLLIPACAATYDPSPFRPGMPAWNARIGKIAFNNGTAKNTRVTLYSPNAPNTPFGTWDVAPGMNAFLGDNNYGMDWAIKVDDSNPCIIGLVSDWNSFEGTNIFQTWPEKLLSQPGSTGTPLTPACGIVYDPSLYRPGTANWDNHVGKIAFYNGKDVPIKVSLFHPDTPNRVFGVWHVQPKANLYLGDGIYGTDWGIKVDKGNTCIVGTVSDWDPSSVHFQTWLERLL